MINFPHTVPISRAHGVDAQPSLLLDHNTDIRVHWNPADVFPTIENANLFRVNVIVYQYHFTGEDGDGSWVEHTRRNNRPNNGQASVTLVSFNNLHKEIAYPTCIEVALGNPVASTQGNERALLENVSKSSNQPGIWSGLLFSTLAIKRSNRDKNQEFLMTKFSRRCTLWHKDPQQLISQDIVNTLPPCPPTLGQSQLPNSGLEEERMTSIHYSTTYHDQWMRYFHGNATKCYIQSGVRRYTGMHVLMHTENM